MATTTTLLTFAEFEQLPDEPAKLELLEGELVRMPPTELKHLDAAHRLFAALLQIVEGLRRRCPDLALGKVYLEAGYLTGTEPGTWLVPDVSISHRDQSSGDY